MARWLGTTWPTVGFVVVSTIAVYLSAIVGVRVAGRRTVSQMSAFDFVITVALGSLIASTAVSRDPSLLQGLAGLATLLTLQVILGMLRQRSPRFANLLDFRPETVYEHGAFQIRRSPFAAQVTRDEIISKVRSRSGAPLDAVSVVILEPDGSVSVMRSGGPG